LLDYKLTHINSRQTVRLLVCATESGVVTSACKNVLHFDGVNIICVLKEK